ncbi:MAG: thioesterase family protein [Solirubrobacteraceae bacterium]
MSSESIFVHDGDRFTATELAVGPWDPGALHGGAPAALLVHAVLAENLNPAFALARMTCEFVRPVPTSALQARVEIIRPGRRVTLLDAFLTDGEGTEVVRARALLLTPSELGDPDPGPPPPFAGPQAATESDWAVGPPMFATHGMDIRFVEGEFRKPGPATAWFRLRHPLIAGHEIHPMERLTAAGDFGNGIASVLSWEDHVFINPDLTLQIERAPVGEWVALQSEMRVGVGAIAVAESVLWDERGRIGRASQALLVSRR